MATRGRSDPRLAPKAQLQANRRRKRVVNAAFRDTQVISHFRATLSALVFFFFDLPAMNSGLAKCWHLLLLPLKESVLASLV